MNNVSKEYTIKPIKIQMTAAQKQLTFAMSILKEKISYQYQKFIEFAILFKRMLDKPEHYKDTILSIGFNRIDTLQKDLNQWVIQYKNIDVLNPKIFLAKLKDADPMNDRRVWEMPMLSSEALEMLSKREHPQQLSSNLDPYQEKILISLWELKWAMQAKWYASLSYIDHYNRVKTSNKADYTLPVTLSEGANPHSLPMIASDPEALIVEIKEKLSRYINAFKVIDLGAIYLFRRLEDATAQSYRQMITHMDSMRGRSPEGCQSELNRLVTLFSNKINLEIENLKKIWVDMVNSDENTLLENTIDGALKQSKALLVGFSKPSQKKMASFFLQNSLLSDFMRGFLSLLQTVDGKIHQLECQYARSLYILNCSFYLTAWQVDSNRSQAEGVEVILNQAKEEIDTSIFSLREYFAQIAQKSTIRMLTLTMQESSVISQLDQARSGIRKTYFLIQAVFNRFKYLAQQGHVLSEGASISEVSLSLEQIRKSILSIMQQMESLQLTSERNEYYWIHEEVPSAEIVEKLFSEKRQMTEQVFDSVPQEGVYALQKEMLHGVLTVWSKNEVLFYNFIKGISDTPNYRDFLNGIFPLDNAICLLSTQLEEYKKLFSMGEPLYLSWLNGLLGFRELTFEKYKRLRAQERYPFINLQDAYNFIVSLITSLKEIEEKLLKVVSPSSQVAFASAVENIQTRLVKPLGQKVSINDYQMFLRQAGIIGLERTQKAKYFALSIMSKIILDLDQVLRDFSTRWVEANYTHTKNNEQTGKHFTSYAFYALANQEITQILLSISNQKRDLQQLKSECLKELEVDQKAAAGKAIVLYEAMLKDRQEEIGAMNSTLFENTDKAGSAILPRPGQ